MRSDWSTWASCIPGEWQRPPCKTDALGYVKDAKISLAFWENSQKIPQHQKFKQILDVLGGCGRGDILTPSFSRSLLSFMSRCNWVLRVQRVRGNLFGH